MKDALIVSLLSLTPRKRGARTMGWIARRRASKLAVRWFVRSYGVDLDEAEGDLREYPTLEALFTRTLKPGMRPIDTAPAAMVSPVDGRVARVGRTRGGQISVAPDRRLSVAALLDDDRDGEWDVAVLYLSPKDYHRVHVPREGKVVRWRYIPGTLWPVFPTAVRRIKGLFSRNERVHVRIETGAGPIDCVLVGAFGVGRISLSFCDLITNTGGRARAVEVDPPVDVERGEWLGTFHLGSTVILAAPPDVWTWEVAEGEAVRLGQPIARCTLQLPGGEA